MTLLRFFALEIFFFGAYLRFEDGPAVGGVRGASEEKERTESVSMVSGAGEMRGVGPGMRRRASRRRMRRGGVEGGRGASGVAIGDMREEGGGRREGVWMRGVGRIGIRDKR